MSSHVSENRIKVLIADDHALIRQGLKSLLSFDPEITVVAEAEEGKSIVPMLKQYRPDVLLMDINMPGMTGIEVLSKIKADQMQIKIIFLTVEDNQKIIMKAIEIGADGYVLKGSPPEELIEAVKSVYFGENYIDKSLVSVLFEKVMHRSEGQKYFRELTDREMEILYFISKGLSNKEIGEKLFLSEKTIKNNATRIFRKIGVNDRVQATIFAIENELSKFMQNI
jgi:DNA-binding NarL/FixJ family response regulator